MAESTPPPSVAFEHVPNLRDPLVIESSCLLCGLLVGASSKPHLLTTAELAHTCSGWLKVY